MSINVIMVYRKCNIKLLKSVTQINNKTSHEMSRKTLFFIETIIIIIIVIIIIIIKSLFYVR